MNYSHHDIERYWKGQMTPSERHALEKAALEDPFLADALEGYQGTEAAAIQNDLSVLREQLAHKVNTPIPAPAPVAKMMWWKIAASVVVMGGLGYVAYQFNTNRSTSSVVKETSVTPLADSNDVAAVTQPDTNIQSESNAAKIPTEKTVTGWTRSDDTDSLDRKGEDMMATKDRETEDLVSANQADRQRADSIRMADGAARQKEEKAEEKKVVSAPPVASKNLEEIDTRSAKSQSQGYADMGKKSRAAVYRARVVDNENNGLPYANVLNLGNSQTTLADRDGYFVVPIEEDSLVLLNVSSQGFQSREFRLNRFAKTRNDLVLYETPDNSQPAELTVVVELEEAAVLNDKKSAAPAPQVGWAIYNQYVANNLTRQKEDLSAGEVVLGFTISKSGKPANIRVIRPLQSRNDQEAIRLLRQGPEWTGGSRNGEVHLIFRFK